MNSVFDLIIPVYNRADLLPRCLQSIEAQSYRPLHVVIVDNNSTDASLEVAQEWQRSHSGDSLLSVTVATESRQGAAAARNRGLALAQGEMVAFVDSDDIVLPDMCARAMEAYDRGAQLVNWKAGATGVDGREFILKWASRDYMRNQVVHSILTTQCFAVSRTFITSLGGWDADLTAWDDWELGIRMLAARPRTEFVDAVLAHTYRQADSITGLSFAPRAGQWESALDKAEQILKDDAEALRLITYRRAVLAAHYAREKEPILAKNLLTLALDNGRLPAWLVKAVYLYTRKGGRGAYLLLGLKPQF